MISNSNKLIEETYDWLLYVIEDYNNFVEDIINDEDGEVIARGMKNFSKINNKDEKLLNCILDKMKNYLELFNITPLEIDNIKIFYFFGFCAFEILNTPQPLIWAIKAILLEIKENCKEKNCNTDYLLQNIMIDKIADILKDNDIDDFKELYGEYGVYTSLALLFKYLNNKEN